MLDSSLEYICDSGRAIIFDRVEVKCVSYAAPKRPCSLTFKTKSTITLRNGSTMYGSEVNLKAQTVQLMDTSYITVTGTSFLVD